MTDPAGAGGPARNRPRLIPALSLAVALALAWVLLSGHYEPVMLALGGLSVCAALAIAQRMRVIDFESVPVHLGLRALRYWPWLAREIWKANLDVMKIVLGGRERASPTLLWLPSALRSDLAQVVYANSITLTPGTISVLVERKRILVHALSRELADGLESGDMHQRVRALEAEG